MIRYLFLFLLIAIISFSCSTIPDINENDIPKKENLILNSGFEIGDFDPGSMPLGWFTVNTGTSFIWDEDFARSGEKSLLIKTGEESFEIISESFPINPNNIFYLQCYVHSSGSVPSSVGLAFMAFDKKGKKVNYFSELKYLDNSWTKIDFRTGFLDDQARFARVIVILPDEKGNKFWIDDVECYVAHSFMK